MSGKKVAAFAGLLYVVRSFAWMRGPAGMAKVLTGEEQV